jgi:opacity protein-like surface antigen
MNHLKSKFFPFLAFVLFFNLNLSHAQDLDLIAELELDEEPEVFKARASFKTTRVVNSHSLETTHKNVLDFRISHRFGLIAGGINEFFGLDQATMRLGFDYGILDNLTVGIGRSTYEKTVDGFVKYKPLWQTEGSNRIPISLLVNAGASVNTLRFPTSPFDMNFTRRLNYYAQIIAGRKFNDKFTFQLMPTYVHRNLVATRAESNSVFALGAATRYKVIKRMAINLDYYYVLPNQLASSYSPHSFSIGLDLETGGHVFQVFFSNSMAFIEKAFIAENSANFFKGDIHFGFTISRVFDFNGGSKKDKRAKEEM